MLTQYAKVSAMPKRPIANCADVASSPVHNCVCVALKAPCVVLQGDEGAGGWAMSRGMGAGGKRPASCRDCCLGLADWA